MANTVKRNPIVQKTVHVLSLHCLAAEAQDGVQESTSKENKDSALNTAIIESITQGSNVAGDPVTRPQIIYTYQWRKLDEETRSPFQLKSILVNQR